MTYVGDFALGSTFDVKFCTVQATGAPFTLAGSPVVSAYFGNDATQITAGITLSVDFDSVTGLHNVRVVATSGNTYATATNYQLVITTGTVNSISVVGYVVAQFSIENRSALRPATAARTLVVDAAGLADANVVKLGPTGSGTAQTARDIGTSVLLSSGTGTGQVKLSSGYVAPNWGDVGNPTTVVGLTNTTVGLVTLTTTTTTVTNQLTAAVIATGVWQDATAGDFTAASSIGKSLYTAGVVPGGTNGLFIAGTNAATTVTTSFTTTFTGNLTGSVGSVTGAVGSVTGAVGSVTGSVGSVTGAVGSVTGAVGSVTGSIGSLGATAKSDVNAEVVDALSVDTYTEPSSVPAATASLAAKIGWTQMLARNAVTQNAITQSVLNDAGSSSIGSASVSDSSGTFTRGKWS